jgi:hypothetical protein
MSRDEDIRMGPQFIRFDKYGQVGAHCKNSSKRKRSMHDIAAEQVREPHACPHLKDPKPHILRYGCDPREAVAFANGLARQALDARGRHLRCDAPIILAGVVTWPEPLTACLADPEAMARWVAFRDETITWLGQYWGDHLMSVVEHVDEDQPHIQFVTVARLDTDRRLRLSSIHPGLRAEKLSAETGASKRDQRKAHQAAMELFQDTFYYDVASRHGLTRLGKKRQRLERHEWKAQKKAAKALAEAGRLQREKALKSVKEAEFRASETIALVQQDARAQVEAAKAEAERRVAAVKDKAVRIVSHVQAELTTLRQKVDERDATISLQANQIEDLLELLREHGVGLSVPGLA